MFLSLLGITFLVSVVVCFVVAAMFDKPIDHILERIVADDVADAWTRYLDFAIYVVGISGGVRINELEAFILAPDKDFVPPVLSTDRWVLEIYRTVIESLQSIAWMLLIFFVFALVAYVILRAFTLRADFRQSQSEQAASSDPHRPRRF